MRKILSVMALLAACASGVGCGAIVRHAVDETKEAFVNYMQDEGIPAIKSNLIPKLNSYVDNKIKELQEQKIKELDVHLAEFDVVDEETGIKEGKRARDFDVDKDGELSILELASITKYIALKRTAGHGSNGAAGGAAAAIAALAALGAAKAAKDKMTKKPAAPATEPAKV